MIAGAQNKYKIGEQAPENGTYKVEIVVNEQYENANKEIKVD
nr:YjzC family protein [Bacillus sp. FJAT-44742]